MTSALIPPGVGHQVTYRFVDIFHFQTLALLPLENVAFTLAVNAAGPWSATLNVEDPGVRKSQWIAATEPWRTAMFIDIDGTLVYGGIVTGQKYNMATGRVTLSGSDFCGYLSQRIQAQDYKEYTDPEGHAWAVEPGAPVPRIAYWLLYQALVKEHSVPITVAYNETTPDTSYWITYSAPLTQQQTLASMLGQLQQLGYLVGVDYACDVQYVAGTPAVSITLSYPRRGSAVPTCTIETSAAVDFEYDVDGTLQGNRVVEQAGAIGAVPASGQWNAALEQGYPLLEKVVSHAALSPTKTPDAVLDAYIFADLATYAYPLSVPAVTLPMFGTPSLKELLPVGGDVTLRVPTTAGGGPGDNPRFPTGLSYHYRVVRLDCTIPPEGVPLMKATLNIPPGTVPPQPPN